MTSMPSDQALDTAIALHQTGRLDEAIALFERAIQQRPAWAEAYCELGSALRSAGRLNEALNAYSKAVQLKPNLAAAHNNMGNVLKDTGSADEALAAYSRATQLNPHLAVAFSNMGSLLKDSGRLDEAITASSQALALEPNNARFHSNLIYTMCFHPAYDNLLLGKELQQWSQRHAEPLAHFIQPHANNPDPNRRLKIGYVSPDFRNHVVGQNLLPLLSHHDPAQVEIFCYSNSLQSDFLTNQLRSHAHHWRNIPAMPDEAAAQLIRRDGIDLLVDLSLHTADNRLPLFARKPAPVQLTYLGYCGATGLKCIDYRLSDPYIDPPESDLSVYSEQTLRLPRSYWCYCPGGEAPIPNAPPVQHNGYITFGCVNHFAKVSAAALDLWTQVLLAVPLSRLVLHANPGLHRQQALDRLGRGGVAANRIEFVAHLPWLQYMQTYHRIDICLDPFPHNGGITTCDSLWMGVPVVSLSGQTPVGRGGLSILSNVGLADLAATDSHQYVSIASAWAGNVPRLAKLRESLRSRMAATPLMDAPGFARDIEAAYRIAWAAWCNRSMQRQHP